MTRLPKWCLGAFSLFTLSWCATAAPAQRGTDLVKPQLVVESSGIEPGKPFRVGVLLRIEPHWHVYWKNPGDSGQATTVTFELPEGFQASPLRYPVPTKFLQPGDLVAYGYADAVMLIATITPPDALQSKVSLRATVKYLVCDETRCLPGKQDVSLDLQGVADATPDNLSAFGLWEELVPAGGDAAKDVADVTPSARPDHQHAVDVTWKQPADNVEFFPGKTRTLNVHDVTVKNKGNKTHITFAAEPLANQKPDVTALDSVIAYTDDRGVRRGLEVAVPINTNQK